MEKKPLSAISAKLKADLLLAQLDVDLLWEYGRPEPVSMHRAIIHQMLEDWFEHGLAVPYGYLGNAWARLVAQQDPPEFVVSTPTMTYVHPAQWGAVNHELSHENK